MLRVRPGRLGVVLGGLLGALAIAAAPLAGPSPAAYAANGKMYACSDVSSQPQKNSDWPTPITPPADLGPRMGSSDALAAAPTGGRGYQVEILDSGLHSAQASHGSVLQGLVQDFAPHVDVPANVPSVWKSTQEGSIGPDADLVDRGLAWAAAHATSRTIVLLGVPLESVGHRDDKALDILQHRGAVVVDPVGVPPQDTGEASPSPAGYDDTNPRLPFHNIVTVSVMPSSSTVDPGSLNDADSSTAFTLPTYGARSSVYGRACAVMLQDPTSAAAEFAGMLALVASTDPHVSLREWVDRLEATATGGAAGSMYVGHGVPQPLAAIGYRPPGKVAAPPPVRPPAMPAPVSDVLAGTKHHAVWWGLCGGGALLLALVLRPLLSRRR